MYVPGASIARLIKSARKRGEGDLVVVARRMNGWIAPRAFAWTGSILQSITLESRVRRCFKEVSQVYRRVVSCRQCRHSDIAGKPRAEPHARL